MQLSEILKTLDIDLEIEGDAIITDAIVTCKVQRMNGSTTVAHAKTEGTDWITATGLCTVAYEMATENLKKYDGED